MAISQVTRGVFVLSPEPSKNWEATQAGQYARIFTKARQEQWELSQKQALMEYKAGSDRFEEEMKAYRDRLKSLDAAAKANAAALTAVQQGVLKAGDAAKIAAMKTAVDVSKEQAALEAKAKEQVSVNQGGRSSSQSSSSGTGAPFTGATARQSMPSDEAQAIQDAKAAAKTLDPVVLSREIERRVEVGNIAQTDPIKADRMRYSVARESIEQYKSDLIAAGNTGEQAEVKAEKQVLGDLKAAGQAGFAAAYERHKATLPTTTPAVSTHESQSSSQSVSYGSKLENRYPGLSAQFPLLTPEEQQAILARIAPEDRQGLVDTLQARQEKIDADITGLARPEMSSPDFINRSRDIAASHFGPTRGYAPYEQRSVLQGVMDLPEADRQALLADYRNAGSGPATSTSPLPIPAPAPASRYRAEDFATLGLDPEAIKMLAQPSSALAAAQVTPFTRPAAPIAHSFAAPPVSTVASFPYQYQRGVVFDPERSSPRLEAPLPAPVPLSPPIAPEPSLPPLSSGVMFGDPRTPLQSFSPAMITAGTNLLETKAKRESGAATGAEATATALKSGLNAGDTSFYGERFQAAYALKDQPQKLARLAASGPGKVGYQLWATNRAKGVPFSATYKEIVLTFAGDPVAMQKAIDVAMASAMAAHDSVNPKP